MQAKQEMPRDSQPEPEESDPSDVKSAYLEYNKILRTWFVAFGIGGPALFLVNDKIAGQLAKVGSLRFVAACFLSGAIAQVLVAMVNKFSNWYVYMAALDEQRKDTWQCRLADTVIQQFWFDVAIDIATLVVFSLAAWQMFTVFAKAVS